MKKHFSIVIFLFVSFLICSLSYGQNNMEDVVYFKNGSIIRGIIIEQIPYQSIKIQTKDRSVFVFKYDEIEKMNKENLTEDNTDNSTKDINFKKYTYINLTEFNYCMSIGQIKLDSYSQGSNNNFNFGFRTVNAFQLNEYLSFGIGVGIDKNQYTTLVPITFDARVSFIKGKFSPVINANLGYEYGFYEMKGGMVINPSIGVRVYISKNLAYLFSIGYKWHQQGMFPDAYPQLNKIYSFQSISISTGFSFW